MISKGGKNQLILHQKPIYSYSLTSPLPDPRTSQGLVPSEAIPPSPIRREGGARLLISAVGPSPSGLDPSVNVQWLSSCLADSPPGDFPSLFFEKEHVCARLECHGQCLATAAAWLYKLWSMA